MKTAMKMNSASFLFLALQNKKEFKKDLKIRFEFCTKWAHKLKTNLPSWFLETIQLIPPNSLMRDFDREFNHPYFWENFLNTLYVRYVKKEVIFNLNTRVQVTPFGIHFKVGFDDEIDPEFFAATSDLFFQMVGRRCSFTQHQGYLVISFTKK